MTRLLLIRHAQSEWNAQRRWQGQADPGLSDRGRLDARAAAAKLDGAIERIVSSDLERAAATADIIRAELGLDAVERDPAFREIDVGEWSGLTSDEIEVRWPGALRRWREGGEAPVGGEDRGSFRGRMLNAVESLARRSSGSLLVVTHGAVIGVLERHLDVYPDVPVVSLSGRWFEFDDALRAADERVALTDISD